MDLQAKIDEFKAKTKEIRDANPSITQVNWAINDIPFPEFQSFLRLKNISIDSIDQTSNGQLFFFPNYGHNSDGCQIVFMSLPVKLRREVKYIEVEEEPA